MARSPVTPVQSCASHLICEPRLNISNLLLCCLAGCFAMDAVRSARLREGNCLNLVTGRLCMGAVCFRQCPPHYQGWWSAGIRSIGQQHLSSRHTDMKLRVAQFRAVIHRGPSRKERLHKCRPSRPSILESYSCVIMYSCHMLFTLIS